MNICIFAPDIPYPPNRGGRVDPLRRVLAMRKMGHDVYLICGELSPDSTERQRAEAYFKKQGILFDVISPARKVSLLRNVLKNIFVLPFFISKRLPDSKSICQINHLISGFEPDLLWVEGPWLWPIAEAVRCKLNVPLAYRSHNIEHRYMATQRNISLGWMKRLVMLISFAGLKRVEFKCVWTADAVFDISIDDMNWWAKPGSEWLPPQAPEITNNSIHSAMRDEFVFIGNLKTPNNISGILWLCKEVLPLVLKRMPHVKFRVIGSSPSENLVAELKALGVVVNSNVEDIFVAMAGAGVLVNPVMVGSGMQLKTIDMLMTERPIVSTSQGLSGMPKSVRRQFCIADTAQDFADGIVGYLSGLRELPEGRSEVRKLFSDESLVTVLSRFEKSDRGTF